MDERKLELKRLRKASAAVKRKNTGLWSWLSVVSLLLALLTTAASVCCLLVGGAAGAYYSGKLWETTDTDAVYFASDYETPEDRAAAMETLQSRAVTEGAVLLKNNGALPISAEINVDVLSVGTAGIVYDETLVMSAPTPEACKQLPADGEKKTVLILNTPELPSLDFLETVDACLWTGGTKSSKAVAELLTGKQMLSGSLAVTGCYDPAETPGIYEDYQHYETQYTAFVTGNQETYDYSKVVARPFGYGLSYTTFGYSNMTLSYDVAADLFTVTVTVTNTGDRAGKETVQLYLQVPSAESDREHKVEKAAVKLIGFAKTDVLEAGSAQTVTITAERQALASYDASGNGGYVLSAGDYYFTVASDAHAAANQFLAMQGYTPDNTEGRMDALGETGLTGVYTQTEADAQSYRLSATGAEVKNRFAAPAAAAPSKEMPNTSASNGLRLLDLRGLAFDDPLWESLLDQMNYWQMAALANISFSENMEHTPEETIPRGLLANAFDPELAFLAGKDAAEQCLEEKKHCLSAERISAGDSFLAATLFTAQLRGVREKGILAAVQLDTVADLPEQTIRQRLLEPYRVALTKGSGSITADPICFDLLKTEWGYAGVLLEKERTELPIMQIAKDVLVSRQDPAKACALREQCHRSLYSLVNSAAMNGVGADTQPQGVRLSWYYGIYIAAGALWITYIVMGALYSAGRRKWKDSPEYRSYRTLKTVLKEEK